MAGGPTSDSDFGTWVGAGSKSSAGWLLDQHPTSLEPNADQSSMTTMGASPSEDKGISLCDARAWHPATVWPTHLLHLSLSRVEMRTERQAVLPRQQGFGFLSHLQKDLPFPEEALQSRKTCGDYETGTN